MIIYINEDKWMVFRVSEDHPILVKPDGSQAIGVCDKSTFKIYIDENIKGAYLQKVLCHELVHAAMFSYNVILTELEEELMADLFATYGREILQIVDKVFQYY